MRLITDCEKLMKQESANPHDLLLNTECVKNDRDVPGKMKRDAFEAMSTELLARAERAMLSTGKCWLCKGWRPSDCGATSGEGALPTEGEDPDKVAEGEPVKKEDRPFPKEKQAKATELPVEVRVPQLSTFEMDQLVECEAQMVHTGYPLAPPEPPQPPEPPTVVEEEHSQDDLEDVDGDSLKELQPKHVEADVSYRPSDASFRMMLPDNSLRDDQVNTACQDNTSTGGGVVDYISERKFITFESCLDELLMRCPKCTALMRTSRKKVKGTWLFVYRTCANGHELVWSSQPCVHRRPLGSILLAAATLFSGSVVKKVLRLLNKMGVPCFSHRTYFNIQSSFLLPAIRRSNETKGSWAMELEGLKRTLVVFEANGLIVESIITDRHSMIKSFLSKDHPQIRHMFDCWHVAKAGKLKSLSALQDWVEPIVKHLYWCAESSDGAPEDIFPKWTSLVAHVADVHEHADAIYPRCQHGDLGWKKWLSEATDRIKKERVDAKNAVEEYV
ncbi:hypothetical protein ISCGN_026813 [Ixodes scapularis]